MVEEYRVKVSRAYAKLIILLIPAVLLIGYLGAGLAARHAGLELPLWLRICWSVYILTILHVATMGLFGTFWLKLPIDRMSFGTGKRWLQINIAAVPISFGIFFFNGGATFAKDERILFSWRRSLVELSGCAVLLALAAAIMQGDAPLNILAFWQQLIEGALSPFSHAQLLLMELRRYLSGLDELSILAVVSFGLAGINLLPLPPLNGGNALMYFVSSTLYPLTPRAQEWLFRVGFLTFIAGCGSWLMALLFLAYNESTRG